MGQNIKFMDFGGTTAGDNPEKKYKTILTFGDWVNGEYSGLLQFLSDSDGSPFSEFVKEPKKYGFHVRDDFFHPEVRDFILETIGLEFKEYILQSRYERPVIVINGFIARDFKFFKDLYSKYNIELNLLNLGSLNNTKAKSRS